jgi:hypothetical protein
MSITITGAPVPGIAQSGRNSMSSMNELAKKVDDVRGEILYAISQRFAGITGGKIHTTLFLHGVNVNSSVPLQVNSLFYSRERLCGDCVRSDDEPGSSFLFGRSLEDLHVDDLMVLLNALYSDRWSTGDESPVPAAPVWNRSPVHEKRTRVFDWM